MYINVLVLLQKKMDNEDKSINCLSGNQIKQSLFMNTFKRLQEIEYCKSMHVWMAYFYNIDSVMAFLRHPKYRIVG